jgi:hypothetical protein
VLSVTTSTSTPSGTYSLEVTGTSGNLSHIAAIKLVVDVPSSGGDDDIGAYQTGTYASSFAVSGTKDTNVIAALNSQTLAGVGTLTWQATLTPPVGTTNYTIIYSNIDGSSAGSKVITIDRRIIGDINGDGKVDVLDLSLLFSHWNQTAPTANWVSLTNINNWLNLNPSVGNTINILDLSLLFGDWTH